MYLCSGEQAVVSKQAVQAGCHALLNTMGTEDVIGDAPKAADWVRVRLAVLLHTVGHCCCTWTRRKQLCRVVLCAAVVQISEFCDLVAPGRHVKVRGGGFHIRLRFN